MRRLLFWFAGLFLATMFAATTYADHVTNPTKGRQLFRSYCLVCHGNDGKSMGPVARLLKFEPADLTSKKYHDMKVEDLALLIGGYEGRNKIGMPEWGAVFSEQDLLDVASYVNRLTEEDLRFRGDTRRGRIIFKNACASCHGNAGRGDGVLAYLFQIPMPDFAMSETMKVLDDEQLIDVVREGKGPYMAPWKESLADDEIIDVSAYVRLLSE